MPKHDRPAGAAQEARTINNLSDPLLDRADQIGIFTRIIFQISVLNDEHITCGFVKPRLERCAFAAIFSAKNTPGKGLVLCTNLMKDLRGAIRGAVIDEYDLTRDLGGFDPFIDLFNRVFLVINRNNDADLHTKNYKSTALRSIFSECYNRP